MRDANGQSLAYVMSREDPSDARTAKMLTDEEAQWIASNIAKLPSLLGSVEALSIAELWTSIDPAAWERALARYWSYVRPENLDLERSLDSLDLERLREMDSQAWYRFCAMNILFGNIRQPIDTLRPPDNSNATLTMARWTN